MATDCCMIAVFRHPSGFLTGKPGARRVARWISTVRSECAKAGQPLDDTVQHARQGPSKNAAGVDLPPAPRIL